MEKQVAKLKEQVRTLKETIKEMEYQRDKKAFRTKRERKV